MREFLWILASTVLLAGLTLLMVHGRRAYDRLMSCFVKELKK